MTFTTTLKPVPARDGIAVMQLPQPRGRELSWPKLWEGAGQPWYQDAREHRPPTPAQAAAVRELLTQPLNSGYFDAIELANEVAAVAGVSVTAARQLLRTMPHAVTPEPGVWCGEWAAAADAWPVFRGKVLDVIKADAAMTFEQVMQALPMDAPTSVYAALQALMMRGQIVALRETPGHGPGPFYVHARPGHDYRDLLPAAA